MTEDFEEFLTAFCSVDIDPEETTVLMRGALGAHVGGWLRPELDQVIHDGSLTPELATYLTSRDFTSAEQVHNWLTERRQAWFGTS